MNDCFGLAAQQYGKAHERQEFQPHAARLVHIKRHQPVDDETRHLGRYLVVGGQSCCSPSAPATIDGEDRTVDG